jgi:hypothetical protein
MSFWQDLFGSKKAEQSKAPAAPPPVGDYGEIPYDIARRPMPKGDNAELLLPKHVGPYTRESIAPVAKGAPIYGNYHRGSAIVFVELGICDSPQDAVAALETARDESTGASSDLSRASARRGDISCFKRVNESGAFLAWTRGRYFFSAHAKGGEQDLDQFVQEFPS